MKKTFTIETTLHINEYAGLKVSRVRNDNITCSEIPRALIKPLLTGQKISNEKDIQELRKRSCNGLYFLVNYRDLRIHIKKTNSILDSIFSEAFEGDKKTWFHHVLFFRKDFSSQMSQAELDYIEWYFIEKVVVSGLNKKNDQPILTEPMLDERTQEAVNKIIRSINVLLMESSLKLHSSEVLSDNYDDFDDKYGSPISNVRERSRMDSQNFSQFRVDKLNREEKFESVVSSVMNRNIMNFKRDNLITNTTNMDSIRRQNVVKNNFNLDALKSNANSMIPNEQWKIKEINSLKPNQEQKSNNWAAKIFDKTPPNKDLSNNNFKIEYPKRNSTTNNSNFVNSNRDNDSYSKKINLADKNLTISKLKNINHFNAPLNESHDLFTRNKTTQSPIREAKFESTRTLDSLFDKPKNNALFDYLNNEKKTSTNKVDSKYDNKLVFKCQNAKGYYDEGFITLIEGSILKKAKLDPEKMDYNQASIRIRYKEQNEWLEGNHIRQLSNLEYVLIVDIKDIPINIATQHVTGEIGIDGKEYWVNSRGQTINNIERQV